MKVLKWGKKEMSEPGMMLQLNPEEAASLIESLASQLVSKSSNTGRKEFRLEDGMYFSVAVQQPSRYLPSELEVGYVYDQIEMQAQSLSGEASRTLNRKFL